MFSDHSIDNMENRKKAEMSSRNEVWSRLLQTRYQTNLGRYANHEDVNQENLAVKGQPK